MSIETLRLTSIKYYLWGYSVIVRVTFVFTGDIHSPPLGSYLDDPTEEISVLENLRELTFGIMGKENYFYLAKIGQNQSIREIRC